MFNDLILYNILRKNEGVVDLKRLFSVLLALALIFKVLSFASAQEASEWKLTVLHTNDIHAHLENAARLATLIK